MSRKPEPPVRPSKITIPERCHPMAKVVFAEMQRQRVTYDELEYRSGVLRSTFKAWRTNNRPGLDTIEAALGSLGWAVLPVPRAAELPDEIREGLQALADRWGDLNPLLCQLLATVCRAAISAPLTIDATAKVIAVTPRRSKRLPHPDQAAMFDEVAA